MDGDSYLNQQTSFNLYSCMIILIKQIKKDKYADV